MQGASAGMLTAANLRSERVECCLAHDMNITRLPYCLELCCSCRVGGWQLEGGALKGPGLEGAIPVVQLLKACCRG